MPFSTWRPGSSVRQDRGGSCAPGAVSTRADRKRSLYVDDSAWSSRYPGPREESVPGERDSNVCTRQTPRNCSARETRLSRLGNDSWIAISTGVCCQRRLGFEAGASGEFVAREEPHP